MTLNELHLYLVGEIGRDESFNKQISAATHGLMKLSAKHALTERYNNESELLVRVMCIFQALNEFSKNPDPESYRSLFG
jgi:hypothetical protein